MELDDLWSAAVTGDENYYKDVVESQRNRIRSSFYAHTHSSSRLSNNQHSSSVLGSKHARPSKDHTSCTIATVSHSRGDEGGDDHTGQKDYYLDEHRPRINSGWSYEESLFDEQNKLRTTRDPFPVSERHQGETSRREMKEQKTPERDDYQRKLSSDPSSMNEIDHSPHDEQLNQRSHRNPATPDGQGDRYHSDDSTRNLDNGSGRKQVGDTRERTRRTSHRSQKQREELDKRLNRLVSECLHMGSPSNDEDESIADDGEVIGDSQEDGHMRSIKTEKGLGSSERINERFGEDKEGGRYGYEGRSQGYREEVVRRSSVHWNRESERSLEKERERERERHDRDHLMHDESSQGSTQRSESSSSSDGGGGRFDERGEVRVRRAEYGGLRMRNTMSDCFTERRWVDRGLPPGLSSDIGRKRCFSEGYKEPLQSLNIANADTSKTRQSDENSKRFRDPHQQLHYQEEPRRRSPNTSNAPGNAPSNERDKPEASKSGSAEKKTKQDIKQMLIEAGNQSVLNYRNMIKQGKFIARTYVKPPDVVPVMRYKYTVSYPINYANIIQPVQALGANQSKSSRIPKKSSTKSNEKRPSSSVATIDISSSDDDDEDDSDDEAIIVSTSSKEGAAENPIVL